MAARRLNSPAVALSRQETSPGHRDRRTASARASQGWPRNTSASPMRLLPLALLRPRFTERGHDLLQRITASAARRPYAFFSGVGPERSTFQNIPPAPNRARRDVASIKKSGQHRRRLCHLMRANQLKRISEVDDFLISMLPITRSRLRSARLPKGI